MSSWRVSSERALVLLESQRSLASLLRPLAQPLRWLRRDPENRNVRACRSPRFLCSEHWAFWQWQPYAEQDDRSRDRFDEWITTESLPMRPRRACHLAVRSIAKSPFVLMRRRPQ